MIYYTGHGTEDTGDWVFEDSCITFEEIMDIYLSKFRGKLLYILSDACYSGVWVDKLAACMDRLGIGACGHLAKKEGILIKLIAACERSTFSYDGFFSEEVLSSSESGKLLMNRGNVITKGGNTQTTQSLDTTNIRCFEGPYCECKFYKIQRSIRWKWSDVADRTWRSKMAGQLQTLKNVILWRKTIVQNGSAKYTIDWGVGFSVPGHIEKNSQNSLF